MDGAPLSRFENPKNPKKKRERLLLFLLSSFSLFSFFRGMFFCFVLLDSSSCWTVEVTVYSDLAVSTGDLHGKRQAVKPPQTTHHHLGRCSLDDHQRRRIRRVL